MRHTVLVISVILFFVISYIPARAAKVSPTPVVVTLADGTRLTVYGHGDEHLSWYTAADGRLVVAEGGVYRIASAEEVATMNTAMAQRSAAMMRRIPLGTATPSYFPHTGSPRALVILVQFSDVKFLSPDPAAVFGYYLNGSDKPSDEQYGSTLNKNTGSVRQYFSDMSGGLYTPQFDVVGPVTLGRPQSYYGGDSGNTKDVQVMTMISEACQAVDDQVDFSQYDSDNDGNADLVYCVYAGYAQSVSGNSADCIWPKSGMASSQVGAFDGKSIRRYGVSNELNFYPDYSFSSAPNMKRINGIGLFCHEFSHTLGLPDLYPTVKSAQTDNQGLELWDLMDGGEYTNNGYTPTPYTPWEKEVMGWQTLTAIATPDDYSLAADQAVKIEGEGGEYIILHNMQNEGWASRLPGHGMLVYRVDYPSSVVGLYDYPNNKAGKPAMTVVPADGLLYSTWHTPYDGNAYLANHGGDPYPGTGAVTEIMSVQLNRSVFTRPITQIAETGGTVTFTLGDNPTGIERVSGGRAETDATIYTLGGVSMGSDITTLPKGVYIRNHKKIVIR